LDLLTVRANLIRAVGANKRSVAIVLDGMEGAA
jgi:hypothetical protein